MTADVASDEPHRVVADLPDALADWDTLAARLGGRPVVCLDFDGTLSPIVDDPDAAALSPGTLEVLDRLAPLCTLAIVSGRGADDVAARVGPRDQHVAGSHGFEVLNPDGSRHDHPGAAASVAVLDEVERRLIEQIGSIPGVVIERKRFGLTIHDRMVTDEQLAHVRSAATAEAARHRGLRVTHGKRVTELRPDVDWHKGRAVRRLVDEIGDEDPTVVYVGDDTTDEDALRMLDPLDVGIIVAEGVAAGTATAARWRLDDTAAVTAWLARLVEHLADRSG